MNIALFGGAFDPPHLGHTQVARHLLDNNLADQVWFVPVYTHPWAKRLGKELLTPYHHRLAMLKRAISNPGVFNPGVDLKIAHYKHISFTYPTYQYFVKKYSLHRFTWVMGSEYLPKFPDFLAGHPQLINVPMYIYPRAGHPLKPLSPHMIPLSQASEVDISSTNIRQAIAANQPIDSFVHPNVATYINSHHLYQTLAESNRKS